MAGHDFQNNLDAVPEPSCWVYGAILEQLRLRFSGWVLDPISEEFRPSSCCTFRAVSEQYPKSNKTKNGPIGGRKADGCRHRPLITNKIRRWWMHGCYCWSILVADAAGPTNHPHWFTHPLCLFCFLWLSLASLQSAIRNPISRPEFAFVYFTAIFLFHLSKFLPCRALELGAKLSAKLSGALSEHFQCSFQPVSKLLPTIDTN